MPEYYKENEEHPQRGATLKKLITENKFFFIVLILLFFWPPISAILDVNKVKNGEIDYAMVIFPVGSIYKIAGYWPAVLFYPILILSFAVFIIIKFIIPKK